MGWKCKFAEQLCSIQHICCPPDPVGGTRRLGLHANENLLLAVFDLGQLPTVYCLSQVSCALYVRALATVAYQLITAAFSLL